MKDEIVVVKVTARRGMRIPGFGSRQCGESFNLPIEVADEVLKRAGFTVASTAKPKKEDKDMPKITISAEKEDDNAL